MSWIRSQSDDRQSDTPKVSSERNYNRDMNSPPLNSTPAQSSTESAKIGESIQIKGTVSGNENLIIDGSVQGTIELEGHSLIIGPNARIEAGLRAKSVIIEGDVKGDITADDKIQITSSGSVAGDLRAPRMALGDGARFAGSVDMGNEKAVRATEAAKPEYAGVNR